MRTYRKHRATALSLLVVAFSGGQLLLPVTARADDKPIVGKPIIKKDPPPSKKDGEQPSWAAATVPGEIGQ